MNNSEKKAYEMLKRKGWTVLRNGWPDFLCFKNESKKATRVMAVEVKGKSGSLSAAQKTMRLALLELGIPVVVVSPELEVLTRKRGSAFQLDRSRQDLLECLEREISSTKRQASDIISDMMQHQDSVEARLSELKKTVEKSLALFDRLND